jgi:hypothetical protein
METTGESMVTAVTVCAKTAKGQEEIERRPNGLSPRLRQMLILMDGRRDTAALQTVFPPELVPTPVQQLLDGGFDAELNPAPAETHQRRQSRQDRHRVGRRRRAPRHLCPDLRRVRKIRSRWGRPS